MPEADQQTSTNPELDLLIDALSNGRQVDALGLLRSQMQSQLPNDPQTALFLRLLERQQQLESERQAADANDAGVEDEEDTLEKQKALSELKEKIDALYTEVETLRRRNDTLSLALGACYLCFGEDPLCEECQGRGLPGSRPPEPEKFRKYVLPAYRRAKNIESARSRPSRSSDPELSRSAEIDPLRS